MGERSLVARQSCCTSGQKGMLPVKLWLEPGHEVLQVLCLLEALVSPRILIARLPLRSQVITRTLVAKKSGGEGKTAGHPHWPAAQVNIARS